MHYTIVMPPEVWRPIRHHLLGDRTCEQLAVVLCGTHQLSGYVRFLVRHALLIPRNGFRHQSVASLELDPAVQSYIYRLAYAEGLSQIDFHTHPGEDPTVHFSATDDTSEAENATYISKKLPGTHYASVVMNTRAYAARVWQIINGKPVPLTIDSSFPDTQVNP